MMPSTGGEHEGPAQIDVVSKWIEDNPVLFWLGLAAAIYVFIGRPSGVTFAGRQGGGSRNPKSKRRGWWYRRQRGG